MPPITVIRAHEIRRAEQRTDTNAAARKLVEIADAAEPVEDGRAGKRGFAV
jgi:hypothetical protein